MLVKMMKNRAIKAFAKKLLRFLVVSWGCSGEYTPGQVDRAISDTGCNANYCDHAYAMYCSEEHFNESSDCDYSELREEVAALCFNGNSGFSSSDFSSSTFDGGFDGGGGGDGGGD